MNIKYLAGLVLALASLSVAAQQVSCDQLKGEIDAKIQARHATGYVLEIVDSKNVNDAKVVGGCDGGSKKIIYRRDQKGGT